VREVLEKAAAEAGSQLEYRGDSAVFWKTAAPGAIEKLA
jgi:hypothetical protein